MRETDRVAIHEAMEQQTISVAKAGITTILNSRVSVLAAANPVYGRYDDTRTPAENIDFLPTILSRFDFIFIVRDVRDEARDKSIARHVMGIHTSAFTSASHRRQLKTVERANAAGASGVPAAESDYGSEIDLKTLTKVSVLLFTVTFHANLAHSLTRSP
jgi:DNA replicative helicase MCM subunit Mcm2 (Cdc46/Mcm family)